MSEHPKTPEEIKAIVEGAKPALLAWFKSQSIAPREAAAVCSALCGEIIRDHFPHQREFMLGLMKHGLDLHAR